MNCFVCKGDLVEERKTYVATLPECVIIVKDVPALVCKQCGEVYYSDEVSDRLEKIVGRLKKLVKEVAIVEYNEAA